MTAASAAAPTAPAAAAAAEPAAPKSGKPDTKPRPRKKTLDVELENDRFEAPAKPVAKPAAKSAKEQPSKRSRQEPEDLAKELANTTPPQPPQPPPANTQNSKKRKAVVDLDDLVDDDDNKNKADDIDEAAERERQREEEKRKLDRNERDRERRNRVRLQKAAADAAAAVKAAEAAVAKAKTVTRADDDDNLGNEPEQPTKSKAGKVNKSKADKANKSKADKAKADKSKADGSDDGSNDESEDELEQQAKAKNVRFNVNDDNDDNVIAVGSTHHQERRPLNSPLERAWALRFPDQAPVVPQDSLASRLEARADAVNGHANPLVRPASEFAREFYDVLLQAQLDGHCEIPGIAGAGFNAVKRLVHGKIAVTPEQLDAIAHTQPPPPPSSRNARRTTAFTLPPRTRQTGNVVLHGAVLTTHTFRKSTSTDDSQFANRMVRSLICVDLPDEPEAAAASAPVLRMNNAKAAAINAPVQISVAFALDRSNLLYVTAYGLVQQRDGSMYVVVQPVERGMSAVELDRKGLTPEQAGEIFQAVRNTVSSFVTTLSSPLTQLPWPEKVSNLVSVKRALPLCLQLPAGTTMLQLSAAVLHRALPPARITAADVARWCIYEANMPTMPPMHTPHDADAIPQMCLPVIGMHLGTAYVTPYIVSQIGAADVHKYTVHTTAQACKLAAIRAPAAVVNENDALNRAVAMSARATTAATNADARMANIAAQLAEAQKSADLAQHQAEVFRSVFKSLHIDATDVDRVFHLVDKAADELMLGGHASVAGAVSSIIDSVHDAVRPLHPTDVTNDVAEAEGDATVAEGADESTVAAPVRAHTDEDDLDYGDTDEE